MKLNDDHAANSSSDPPTNPASKVDTSAPAPAPSSKTGWIGLALRLTLPLVIALFGYFAYLHLSTEPPPEEIPKPEPARLETRVIEVSRQDYPIMIDTQGILQPIQTAQVTSQVTGRLASWTPQFEVGNFVQQGEILAIIDPVDFEAEVARTTAALARTEAALAQEEARARQAKANWDELGFEMEASPLVLREPQLKEAKANLASAQADYEQATLSLARTKIRAPFDAIVLERQAGIGEQIGPSTSLGLLAATDAAEVRLALSPRQLAVLDEEAFGEQREVIFTDALNPALVNHQWTATLRRPEGRLDEVTREVFVIARIEDPFGIYSEHRQLRIGQPLRAQFRAKTLENVIAIPRQALRNVDEVVEIVDGKINRVTIEPIWVAPDELIVREPFPQGALLATSRLPFAPNGAPVTILEDKAKTGLSANTSASNK